VRTAEPSGRSSGLVGESQGEVVCPESVACDSGVLAEKVGPSGSTGEWVGNAGEPVQSVVPGSPVSNVTGLIETANGCGGLPITTHRADESQASRASRGHPPCRW
jgi:hypothetical protein